MPNGGTRTTWTDELIESELRRITGALGLFPSSSELRDIGRNDLAVIISRRGGYIAWSERLGLSRTHSDSDTGWDGEKVMQDLFRLRGYECDRSPNVKAPHDLLVAGVLRVDVKAARFAEYKSGDSATSGWYYRIGKHPQADLIVLLQLDTGKFYGIPWWQCPVTNITVSRSGGHLVRHANNWPLITGMVSSRLLERAGMGAQVAEVA